MTILSIFREERKHIILGDLEYLGVNTEDQGVCMSRKDSQNIIIIIIIKSGDKVLMGKRASMKT